MMKMKYAYTILYVEDVSKTVAFYSNALGFEQKMITPEHDYAEVSSGETTLAFANFKLGRSNFKSGFIETDSKSKPLGFELAFTTDDVHKAMDIAMDNGAVLLEKIVEKPWGQQVGYLRDINGFIIEICTPIAS